jgi:SAM-dependent methyltransferase
MPACGPEIGQLLVCPACRAGLDASESGYACRACAVSYPVRDGVVRMLPPLDAAERQVRRAFDFEHRRYASARYLRISPTLVDDWLADVQLPRDYFKGRTVLDVGCGTGRWTYAMAALGARVVAVDFSDAAVDVTRTVTRDLGGVEVVQASLFRLPFRPAQFDFVVSWGVLHHTRDTARAFETIAPLVRPGGHLHVMVYERRSPLRAAGTELLRMAMRRLSPETRYKWCGRLIIRNRLVFHLLRGFIECVPARDLTETKDFDTVRFGLYDWYSPRYNHLHSVEEVRGWFSRAGCRDITLTSPVRFTRPLDVFRFGQCGGSISMRGRRAE